MIGCMNQKEKSLWYRTISVLIAFTFVFTSAMPPQMVFAQAIPTVMNFPIPGTSVPLTAGFAPAMINGITVHADNPLMFDFMVDKGDTGLEGEELEEESLKLIKYFLASLTVPTDKLWVNLSPYEKNRIIADELAETEMGADLLAQDYMLKQLTASLMNPEDELGRKFWDRVYKKAYEQFGTTEIPMNTFNKIWIVPESATVYQNGLSAFVIESHLKVMMEEDYLALAHHDGEDERVKGDFQSSIIREILIPEIKKEVNTGKTFANLRQIFNSMILASWYKKNMKETLLGQIYVNQNKIKGVDVEDKEISQKIYNQYLVAFKEGVHNFIREDVDVVTGEMIPRKYFSGGVDSTELDARVNTIQPSGVRGSSPVIQDGVNRFRAREDQMVVTTAGLEGDQISYNAFPRSVVASSSPVEAVQIVAFEQADKAIRIFVETFEHSSFVSLMNDPDLTENERNFIGNVRSEMTRSGHLNISYKGQSLASHSNYFSEVYPERESEVQVNYNEGYGVYFVDENTIIVQVPDGAFQIQRSRQEGEEYKYQVSEISELIDSSVKEGHPWRNISKFRPEESTSDSLAPGFWAGLTGYPAQLHDVAAPEAWQKKLLLGYLRSGLKDLGVDKDLKEVIRLSDRTGQGIAENVDGLIKIDSRLSMLIPPMEASDEEKGSFQVFITDIFRQQLTLLDNGGDHLAARQASYVHFGTRQADLERLLNFAEQNQIVLDRNYEQALNEIKDRQFTGFDKLLFMGEGKHYEVYEKLGAHIIREGEQVIGTYFAVWAPNAPQEEGYVNIYRPDGTAESYQMTKNEAGIFQVFVPNVTIDDLYKYSIAGFNRLKIDPYAFSAQYPDGDHPDRKASRVADINSFRWTDGAWMGERAQRQALDQPIAVYEVHLGSWKRHGERQDAHGNPDWLTYRELAPELASYLNDMEYTHVEFMPPTEHALYDPGWGYLVTNLFAPTSRYGSPEDFMYLINYLHNEGISVLMDWVPAHFPGDEDGLVRFDGSELYGHENPQEGFHPDWNSYIPNFGRNEVMSYYISNAMFWLKKYHIDGLRVDAVASMLYRDYSRKHDEWVPNIHGGRENLEVVEFLKRFNAAVHEEMPGVLTIAEESTSWPGVTQPTYRGLGLGFDLKWAMGWMNDTLAYMERDPAWRRHHHDEATFFLVYAFTERYALALSHDEVVHGKGSILTKMPGDVWQKFANTRLLDGYMLVMPGAMHDFMGNEFGPWDEWNASQGLDFHLLPVEYKVGEKSVKLHQKRQDYVRRRNQVFKEENALHGRNFDPEGFEPIDFGDRDKGIISLIRRGVNPEDDVVALINNSNSVWEDYRIGMPFSGEWKEILNSDDEQWGGSGVTNDQYVGVKGEGYHGRDHSLVFGKVPPLSIVVLKHKGLLDAEERKNAQLRRLSYDGLKTVAYGVRNDLYWRLGELKQEQTDVFRKISQVGAIESIDAFTENFREHSEVSMKIEEVSNRIAEIEDMLASFDDVESFTWNLRSDAADAIREIISEGRPEEMTEAFNALQQPLDEELEGLEQELSELTQKVVEKQVALVADPSLVSEQAGELQQAKQDQERIADRVSTILSQLDDLRRVNAALGNDSILYRRGNYRQSVEDFVIGTKDQSSENVPSVYDLLTEKMEQAPVSSPVKEANIGGIDLNPENMDFNIDGTQATMPVKFPKINIESIHINGFTPVIINIAPMTNLPLLLGLTEGETDQPLATEDSDSQSMPMELGLVDKYRNKYARAYEYADEDVDA